MRSAHWTRLLDAPLRLPTSPARIQEILQIRCSPSRLQTLDTSTKGIGLAQQFLIDRECVRVSFGGPAPEVIAGLHNPPPVAAHLAIDRHLAEFNTSMGLLILLS